MTKEYAAMRFAAIAALMVVGCSTTKPNPTNCLDNHCSDPKLPFCDVDGAIGGDPNTCIAVDCAPGAFEACRGDHALTCNAAGDNLDLVECEFGCGDGGCKPCDTPACEKHIVPRYVPNVCSELSQLPTLTVSQDTPIDTSNVVSCSSIVTQTTGPEICVLHYNTITIERNQTLKFTGSRAVALVADRAFTVDGIIDVSASLSIGGPAGGTAVSGESAGAGGGAGYRTPGGAAGTTTVTGGANNAGSATTPPAQLTELFGGPRSNAARNNGGGAITLVSCRGTVSVPGLIDAGGGGGVGGIFSNATYRQPTGGGAGGTIVLQGMGVSVTGEIYANGGGGGGGGTAGSPNGSSGLRAVSGAPGGNALDPVDGDGGSGGYSTFVPGNGIAGSLPGAGGGSAGFILTYTPQLVFPTLAPVGVSPGFESNGNVGTN